MHLLMLVLQMLTNEKSRNLIRQKKGKEEMSVNPKFQKFVRKLFEGPHVKSAGLLGLKICFFIEGLKDCFSCVSKTFVNDFYFRGKDCFPCLVQRLYVSLRIDSSFCENILL